MSIRPMRSWCKIHAKIKQRMTEFAENKKARFDYEVLEKLEAGLVLKGFEVKSIKSHRADLTDSYVLIRGGELFAFNVKIYPLQPANLKDYREGQSRKLLLTKKEIQRLQGRIQSQKLTLVPLRLYNKGDFIKLELGLAKSKRKYEKREIIRRRETDKEIQRSLKTSGR